MTALVAHSVEAHVAKVHVWPPHECHRCGGMRTVWVQRFSGPWRCSECDRTEEAGRAEVQRMRDEYEDRTGGET